MTERVAVRAHPEPRTGPPLAGDPWLWALVAASASGLLLCLLSLPGVSLGGLGQFGLLPALPVGWYVGLAVLVAASLVAGVRSSLPHWLQAGQLSAVVVVLYGTVPVLSAAPRYAWTYKHVGVTRYIEAFGSVDPAIDIYHRWPGFFAVAAAYGTLAGRPLPTSYAAYCGLLLVLVQALVVVAIARTLHGDADRAWLAGTVFAVINWVGQDYFAPQPLAFALGLGVLWLAVREFGGAPAGRRAALLGRALRVLTRVPSSEAARPLGPVEQAQWGRGTALVVVAVLFLAVVPSHQLTPYLVVLLLGVLAVAGLLRPWWLPVVLGLLAVAFLVPNFDYVRDTFGLFSGFDVFSNAQPVAQNEHALPGKVVAARAGQALSALLLLAGVVGFVLAWRRGVRSMLVALTCMLAPVLLLFGQSYGGEGALRVVLFSSPWAAVLISSWVVGPAGRRAVVAFALLIALLTTLFLPAYLGQEELHTIPAGELEAAEHLYATGASGSVVVLAAPGFPIRVSERYPVFRGPLSDKDPNLLSEESLQRRPLGQADVSGVVDTIHRYADRGYVVFSTSEETYATVYGLSTAGDLQALEGALLASGRFRVYYRNDTTRIYELVR